VRPAETEGRYIIVSGHRRRAALRLLVEDGEERFRQAACIVERDQASPALRELRLIYANADTRQLSSAEVSRQAERVETLLYQLQEEGYAFPGRMRDHVAEACKVSKTKLGRLKVIRDDLREPFQSQYQSGQLSEQAAYALARLTAEQQELIYGAVGGKKIIGGRQAETLLTYFDAYTQAVESQECPRKPTTRCNNLLGMIQATAAAKYAYSECAGNCCLKCYHRDNCPGRCDHCREQQKEDKAKEAKAKAKRKKQEQRQQAQYHADSVWNARRLLPLIEAVGLGEKDELRFTGYSTQKVSFIRKWAAGNDETAHLYSAMFKPESISAAVDLAKQLHCTTDFLLGLTEDPNPPTLPEGQLVISGWMPGGTFPREPCEVVADFDTGEHALRRLAYFDGSGFKLKQGGAPIDATVVRWMALPPTGEEGEKSC
jgi:ParB family chromosome partitioning protein